MRVFFDNCTAPVFAETLDAFIRRDGHSAHHIAALPELPRGRASQDVEWTNHLRHPADAWIFITGDGRVTRNSAERAAHRSAGLHGFVLASAYQRTPFNQVAAMLIWKWPELVKVTDLLAAPIMHEILIRMGTKIRQLPF